MNKKHVISSAIQSVGYESGVLEIGFVDDGVYQYGGITPSGYTEKYNTHGNTITISEGGNSCGFVNLCTKNFWLGGYCYALEELDEIIVLNFLYFYLKAQEHQIMKLRVGSGLPNIQRKDIEKIEIKYPDFQKQKHIAEKLNTAKKEIELLKKLTKQYQIQKCDLMKKLLAGEWYLSKKKEEVC